MKSFSLRALHVMAALIAAFGHAEHGHAGKEDEGDHRRPRHLKERLRPRDRADGAVRGDEGVSSGGACGVHASTSGPWRGSVVARGEPAACGGSALACAALGGPREAARAPGGRPPTESRSLYTSGAVVLSSPLTGPWSGPDDARTGKRKRSASLRNREADHDSAARHWAAILFMVGVQPPATAAQRGRSAHSQATAPRVARRMAPARRSRTEEP